MSTVNRIVYECVNAGLSSLESADKKVFYEYLKEKYNLDFNRFGDDFTLVHEALKTLYGNAHYRIERVIIRTLNDRAKQGVYERSDEIAAFTLMINIFLQEAETRVRRNREMTSLSEYARTLEQKVKDADDRMKAAERMAAIGETAAMVGHDIRNPLQAIVGELYLQKNEIDSLPEGETRKNLSEGVKAIEENVFYINKIVSDLQDIAKPLKSEAEEEVDVGVVVDEVLTMVPVPSSIQVQVKGSRDFPKLRANGQMLKRALGNLVQNAVQAMPQGGTLTVQVYEGQNTGCIVVGDTGEGIPDEVKSKLFKPLFTTKSKGQGLGLAVVKRLVEAQGGKVSFESFAGDGARFTIELPIIDST